MYITDFVWNKSQCFVVLSDWQMVMHNALNLPLPLHVLLPLSPHSFPVCDPCNTTHFWLNKFCWVTISWTKRFTGRLGRQFVIFSILLEWRRKLAHDIVKGTKVLSFCSFHERKYRFFCGFRRKNWKFPSDIRDVLLQLWGTCAHKQGFLLHCLDNVTYRFT